jgi:glutamate/tyrosine decarboxylase-like PLP-dependent enzyme
LACSTCAHLLAGYGDADSWATDAHKWLNVPYDCGIVFVREPQHLRDAMSTSAAYLVRGEHRDPYDYTPEFSRRARGVEVWAALRSLGREGLADLVERSCRHASRFADGLRRAGCAILNAVVINQVLVSFGDSETTASDFGDPGRRHVLGRRHGVARAHGHAHQRVLMGDDR